MNVTTNYRWRDLKAWHDLPERTREWYSNVTGDEQHSPRFVYYRNWWFDLTEFEAIGRSHSICDTLPGWHGVQTQSAFDAIVVKYSDDHESVMVGHATW